MKIKILFIHIVHIIRRVKCFVSMHMIKMSMYFKKKSFQKILKEVIGWLLSIQKVSITSRPSFYAQKSQVRSRL